MRKYEYSISMCEGSSIDRPTEIIHLNEYAEKGWELVNAINYVGSTFKFYWKREVQTAKMDYPK